MEIFAALQTSSSSHRGKGNEDYLHIVMNTLQKQFTIIGDKFPFLGSPQGAN
jgi:hypothetical protein